MGLGDDDVLRLGTRENRSKTISGDERWVRDRFNKINEVIREPSASRIPKSASNASEESFVTARSHIEESPKAKFDEFGEGYQAGYRIGFNSGYQAAQADRKDSAVTFSRTHGSNTPACSTKSIGSHAASGQITTRGYNKARPETRSRTKTVDSNVSYEKYMQTTYHHIARPSQSTMVGSVCSTVTRPRRAMTVDSGVTNPVHVSRIPEPSNQPQNLSRRDLHPVPKGPFTGNGLVQEIVDLPEQKWGYALPSSSRIPVPEQQDWRPTRGLVSRIPDHPNGKWRPWSSSDLQNRET